MLARKQNTYIPLLIQHHLQRKQMSKRRISDDANQPCCPNHAKRLRPNDCASPSPSHYPPSQPSQPSHPPSQPLLLTEEALAYLQHSLRAPYTKNGKAVSCLEEMDRPPTPRTETTPRVRSRRPARSYGSRTPSPHKKPSPQTYRTRNLHQARVHIDTVPVLPLIIRAQVLHILGFSSWQDRVLSLAEPDFASAAASYLAESRRNASDCALEGDWKARLYLLIGKLTDHEAGLFKMHMSEKGRVNRIRALQ
jgi:hypothetical protein